MYTLGWLVVYKIIEKITQFPKSFEELDKHEKHKNRTNYICIFPCLMNAYFCVFVGGYFLIKSTKEFDVSSDPAEQFIVNFSLSYFLADTIHYFYHNLLEKDVIFHHAGVLIGLGTSTSIGMFSYECLLSLVFAELSNIFLANRSLMDFNKYKGIYYSINGILFIVSFLVCRIFLTFYLMPHLEGDQLKPLMMNLSAIIIFWVTWLWLWKVFNLGTKFLLGILPENKFLRFFYVAVKFLRKYLIIYYVFITWLVTRCFIKARLGGYLTKYYGQSFGIEWI